MFVFTLKILWIYLNIWSQLQPNKEISLSSGSHNIQCSRAEMKARQKGQ